jgi:hypothetical protein
MLVPVVVDLVSEPPTAELSSVLVRACSRAVEAVPCVLGTENALREAGSSDAPRLSAVIAFLDDGTVTIRLGNAQLGWLTRRLHFSAADAPGEIYTAVGYTTGTLARGRMGLDAAEVDANSTTALEPDTRASQPGHPAGTGGSMSSLSPQQSDSPPGLGTSVLAPSLLLGIAAGPARTLGPWRSGGFLGLRVDYQDRWFLGPTARLQQAPNGDGVSFAWFSAGIHGGHRWQLKGPLAVELGAAMIAERVAITARDASTQRQQSASRWLAALCPTADLTARAASSVDVMLGVEVTLTTAKTDAVIGGRPLAPEPELPWQGRLALRWRP